MGWEPPTETEFNDWITPKVFLDFGEDRFGSDYATKRWLIDRLKAGLILGVARNGPPKHFGGQLERFVLVPISLWNGCREDGSSHFWDTGDATFEIGGVTGYGDGHSVRYFDIRFDAHSFDGKPPSSVPDEALAYRLAEPPKSATAVEQPNVPPPPPTIAISQADLGKVARLIAELWGTAITELEALKMAQVCFPNHKVAKHRFLDQYRSVRPAKKPGKQPLNH